MPAYKLRNLSAGDVTGPDLHIPRGGTITVDAPTDTIREAVLRGLVTSVPALPVSTFALPADTGYQLRNTSAGSVVGDGFTVPAKGTLVVKEPTDAMRTAVRSGLLKSTPSLDGPPGDFNKVTGKFGNKSGKILAGQSVGFTG